MSTPTEKKRLNPEDELSPASLKKVQALTDAIHKATDNIDANLSTTSLKVPGQNYVCLTFVSPQSAQKADACALRVEGCFSTLEEANEHVKRLIKLEPAFDIFVCSMYEFLLSPPNPEQIGNQTYQDETLNGIISEYKKNQIYAKEHFEERKRELIEQAAQEAREAALRRIQEEDEPINGPGDLEKSITEVTPSDIMESMNNCEI
jgi:hypothetical protein